MLMQERRNGGLSGIGFTVKVNRSVVMLTIGTHVTVVYNATEVQARITGVRKGVDRLCYRCMWQQGDYFYISWYGASEVYAL